MKKDSHTAVKLALADRQPRYAQNRQVLIVPHG